MISSGNNCLKMTRSALAGVMVVALVIIACAMFWRIGTVNAELRSRNSLMGGQEWSQSGRQQRQIPTGTKLNPNPGTKPNPNRPGPGNLPSPEELELVPLGVARPVPLILAFRQINLSDDQKMKLRNLTRQTGKQIQVLNRLQRAQNEALEEALYSQNFDLKLVEQRAADVANTQGELVKAQARVMAQIRQILRPEQAMRFREFLNEERNRLNQQPPPLPPPTPTPTPTPTPVIK